MASKPNKGKEKSMPNLAAEIQNALEQVLGKGNVIDWTIELTATNDKFDSLSRANSRYRTSDQRELVYGEGDKELVISASDDAWMDDDSELPF